MFFSPIFFFDLMCLVQVSLVQVSLRRIFVPKRGEVTEVWRKLYNEELNDLYPSSTIAWVMKSRTRWA
jgi:hypothetical protein